MMPLIHSQRLGNAVACPFADSDLRGHGVICEDDDRPLLNGMIDAAVRRFEQDTGRVLVNQEWRVTANQWSGALVLPVAPVLSVTEVRYRDTDGAEQVLSTAVYRLHTSNAGARLLLNAGQSLPATQAADDCFAVDLQAGYAADGSQAELAKIPADIVLAVKCLAAHYFENREVVTPVQLYETPMAYRVVVDSYRVAEL